VSAKVKAKGHAAKHVTSKKHASATAKHRPNHHKKPATSKAPGHKVAVKAKHATHAKAAGFAIGDLLPVCPAQALAQSLRLAGQRVTDDEVLELHHRAGGSADVPVSVGDVLAAAIRFGLAGCRPVVKQPGHGAAVGHATVDDLLGDHVLYDVADDFAVLAPGGRIGEYPQGFGDAAQFETLVNLLDDPLLVHGLILHVDVPGPHAVLATADGWWSWGELWSPWAAAVEGAWAVAWT
jgi:hypothetical protein